MSNETVICDEKCIMDLKIVIVGGGLGGLAAALALQRFGMSCKVYESDAELSTRKQGYGLTLTNNAKGPLAQLGLLPQCVHTDCASFCHWVFSSSGNILGYFGRAFSSNKADNEIGRGNLRIPREDLRKMLLDSLVRGTVIWGKRMLTVHEESSHVLIEFEDISTGLKMIENADVVIGADGIRSTVRAKRDLDYQTKLPLPIRCTNESMSQLVQPMEVTKNLKLKTEAMDTISARGNGLKYVHVAVIIGISTAQHPLLCKQGFYVLDGVHRLFTMPFRSGGEISSAGDTSGHNYQTM